MSYCNDPFAALDRSIADLVKSVELDTRMYTRARALMREHGLKYGYSEGEALEQAKWEIAHGKAK